MKRSDMLHAVLGRLREAIARDGLDCEPRGADCSAPSEFVVTVYGKPAEVVRLASALERDPELRDARIVEDLGDGNSRLYEAADADRRRHLHITLSAPSLW